MYPINISVFLIALYSIAFTNLITLNTTIYYTVTPKKVEVLTLGVQEKSYGRRLFNLSVTRVHLEIFAKCGKNMGGA